VRRVAWFVFVALAAVAVGCAAHSRPALGDGRARAGIAPIERVDALARACARVASCAHAHDPPEYRDVSACVEHALEEAGGTDPLWRCLSSSASCADVEACLHPRGDPRAAAFCAAHPEKITGCEAGALVTCVRDAPGESTWTPCGALGAACGETRSSGGLVARGCLSPDRCAADAVRAWCDGEGAILACHDQILERSTCAPGTVCRAHRDADGEEIATCEGQGERACTAVGQRRCDGPVLVRCASHGHHGLEVATDCAALGLRCADAHGRPACVGDGPPCSPGASRCDGSALVFCAAGRSERVACEDLGLGPCETERRGTDSLCGSAAPRPR